MLRPGLTAILTEGQICGKIMGNSRVTTGVTAGEKQ